MYIGCVWTGLAKAGARAGAGLGGVQISKTSFGKFFRREGWAEMAWGRVRL